MLYRILALHIYGEGKIDFNINLENPGISYQFPKWTECLPCFCKFSVINEVQGANNNRSIFYIRILNRSTLSPKGILKNLLEKPQYSAGA